MGKILLLELFIGHLIREKTKYFSLIMGDFNLNLINFQHHQTTGEFLDGLYSNMFIPLITRPSRITCHTATLIDNVFFNDFFDRSRSGLLISDISDHLPIFFLFTR